MKYKYLSVNFLIIISVVIKVNKQICCTLACSS